MITNIAMMALPILTTLPENWQELMDTKILGYTIGGLAVIVANMAYTLIRAKIQRKAIAKGLENNTIREDIHYKELIEYKVKVEAELKEMREDVVAIAETSFRPEAKAIANKYRKRILEAKQKVGAEIISSVTEKVVEEAKKLFR